MVLPKAWKERMGKLNTVREIDCETATQEIIKGEVCGPVEIKMESFEPVYSEVLFLDMNPTDGIYEPLIGYIILEQSQAAVDMLGHRLVHAKKTDLKKLTLPSLDREGKGMRWRESCLFTISRGKLYAEQTLKNYKINN